MLYLGIMIFSLSQKICIMKIGKWIVFPESRHINSKPDVLPFGVLTFGIQVCDGDDYVPDINH